MAGAAARRSPFPSWGCLALTVSTGLVGKVPVGVQIVSGRYREDLCLLAGEAIEAGGTPPAPIDPVELSKWMPVRVRKRSMIEPMA